MGRHTLRLGDSAADIAEAGAILRAGGTVAFATETVYGLGADALNEEAVAKIFKAKQRPAWDPLIVHVCDTEMLASVVASVPEPARLWMERFWPGPLTLLLPRSSAIPNAVTAGRTRVGVRMPRHPVALALLHAAGVPVAAPSANLFGHVSPTTAAHVLTDLDGRIDAVLDGGPAEHGVESTVVDACEDPCVIYRPGAVTLEQLASVWPRVVAYAAEVSSDLPEALPSPGVGLRHYAPRARLVLVEFGHAQAQKFLAELAGVETTLRTPGEMTGAMLPDGLLSKSELETLSPKINTYPWGMWNRPEELAQRLFAGLRALDDAGTGRIVCPLPQETGIGVALCDRLRKAARTA